MPSEGAGVEERVAQIRAFIAGFETQKAAAEALGVSDSTLSKALNVEKTTPGRLASIEAAIARRKLEAIEGRGGRALAPAGGLIVPGHSHDFPPDITVLYDGTIRAGASAAEFVFGEGEELDVERWEMARAWVYEITMGRLWLQPGDRAIRIQGFSMKKPNGHGLDDGQLVFYRPTDELLTGQRYVLQLHFWDTSTFRAVCKRVQVLVDGSLILRSDNRGSGYQDELLRFKVGGHDIGEHFVHDLLNERIKLKVVGRVLWPDETDEERDIRTISQMIEAMAASNLLRS